MTGSSMEAWMSSFPFVQFQQPHCSAVTLHLGPSLCIESQPRVGCTGGKPLQMESVGWLGKHKTPATPQHPKPHIKPCEAPRTAFILQQSHPGDTAHASSLMPTQHLTTPSKPLHEETTKPKHGFQRVKLCPWPTKAHLETQTE